MDPPASRGGGQAAAPIRPPLQLLHQSELVVQVEEGFPLAALAAAMASHCLAAQWAQASQPSLVAAAARARDSGRQGSSTRRRLPVAGMELVAWGSVLLQHLRISCRRVNRYPLAPRALELR